MPAKRRNPAGREIKISFSLKFTESQLFWLIVGFGLLVIEPFVIYLVLYDKVHQERALVADAGRDLQKLLRVPSISERLGGIRGPGHPLSPDYQSDIITPLNVRDPAALVMPPSGSYYRRPPRRRNSPPGGPVRFPPSKSRATPDPGGWEFSSYQ